MTPDVSVVTTAYNAARFLERTIVSVLGQTMRDFEYLLVDDGSTDATLAIARRYADRDARIRVISRPNTGIARAANDGMAACRAPLIARIDSDDIARPQRLASQLDHMRRNDVVALGSAVEFIDDRDRYLTTIGCPPTHEAIDAALLDGHCAIWNTSVMLRREAVEKVGGYDTDFAQAEDVDLWLRLAEIGRLENLPQALTRYRLHAGSVSETRASEQRQMLRLACERAYARRGLDRQFRDPGHWRPEADHASQHQFALRYGWWAYRSGQRSTAVAYAMRAVCLRPWTFAGWRLLAKASVGSPRGLR